ncbi:MAG: hypothetical protein AAF919_03935 [Pseudomonadota bacterium]
MARPLIPALGLVTLLAACNTGGLDTDAERGVAGAAIGAGTAAVLDGDVGTGIVVGALGGIFCDDAGVCR